jgi:hypothetical protein
LEGDLPVTVNPYILMIITGIAGMSFTLLGRWLWDRRLRKGTSRITEETLEKWCKDNQSTCFQRVSAQLSKLSVELTCGDKNFKAISDYQEKTAHTLKLILMTLSELCEVGDGCKPETKEDLRQEILK